MRYCFVGSARAAVPKFNQIHACGTFPFRLSLRPSSPPRLHSVRGTGIRAIEHEPTLSWSEGIFLVWCSRIYGLVYVRVCACVLECCVHRERPVQYEDEAHEAGAVIEFLRLHVTAGCKPSPAAMDPEAQALSDESTQEL